MCADAGGERCHEGRKEIGKDIEKIIEDAPQAPHTRNQQQRDGDERRTMTKEERNEETRQATHTHTHTCF